MEEINVMLDEGAIMPTRAHSADAGLDLYTPEGFMLLSFGEVDNYTVDTGVHMEIPEGYVGMLKSKSGLNVNRGVITEGVIDAGYTGSIKVKLYNLGEDIQYFQRGDKIAQLVILPIVTASAEAGGQVCRDRARRQRIWQHGEVKAMNMQKMGKLCKENMSMKLYRKGCTQYISDGITMVEIPRNLPALCDENAAAAVFGWTDKQLDEISCEVEELDVINDLYEVTGISMDDVSGEEIPCKKAPIGFTYAGMRLLVLRDERGGIAGINERQMEPIMDELKNGQYMVWYRRTMKNGNPYYVLKCGMYLRMAVLPIVFDDVFAAALDEIRAGLAIPAGIRQQMRREGEENDD